MNNETKTALIELEHRYGKEIRDRIEQMGFMIPNTGHWIDDCTCNVCNVKYIEELPRAETENFVWDEWCADCKEYNHENHCCPRFNRIIRETVEEVKEAHEEMSGRWIPVSERLPLSGKEVIVSVCIGTGDMKYNYTSYGWLTTDKEYWIVENEINNYVVAWMLLPDPWKGEEDGY